MLTCVSCFYKVTNKHNDSYYGWFHNTLAIQCPYVFFSDKEGIELIKSYRKELPTYYIECNISDFYTYAYKDHMTTDPIHCPSVELNLIWNEKLFMIEKAAAINPFNSDWFKWIDAGTCTYRERLPPQCPFPNPDKLAELPTDKFIYSSSYEFTMKDATTFNHYHHISGTSYLMHKSMISTMIGLYKEYLHTIANRANIRLDKNNIWTDQVILTHIFIDKPELFFKMCHGYGAITELLF